jgi:hypothetical protein
MLIDSRPLYYPIVALLGRDRVDIRTIGDAAAFIVNLPKSYDGRLHWSLAGSTLEAAHEHPNDIDLLRTATMAFEKALATEEMLG